MGACLSSPVALVLSTPMTPQRRKRMRRLAAAALLLVAYVRNTGRRISQHHTLLQLDEDRLLQGADISTALKYTFVSQLITGSEYLFCLVKPLLAARIGRLLVRKSGDTSVNCCYGPDERNLVDLYGVDQGDFIRPTKPVLVFVHGGAWAFGHKWQYGLVGEYLATQGFLVAVINYRTYPSGSVMDMVEDVENAVFWVAANCHSHGGDSSKIFLSGHSSGGHVSALALVNSALRVASADPKQKTKNEIVTYVQGFIGLSAPYDIADHYVFESERVVGPFNGVHEISSMKPAMLGERNFKKCSPTALVTKAKDLAFSLPPFFLLHGDDDQVVPPSSSEKLAASLQQAGQAAAYCEIRNCSHEGMIFATMGDGVDCREEVVELMKHIMLSSTNDVHALTVSLSKPTTPLLSSPPTSKL